MSAAHVSSNRSPGGLSVRAFHRPLGRLLEAIGLDLAGRAGARMAAQLSLGAARMTLLRRVTPSPDLHFSTPG
ncbi:hypothetical protein [Streptomyces spinosirectus]